MPNGNTKNWQIHRNIALVKSKIGDQEWNHLAEENARITEELEEI